MVTFADIYVDASKKGIGVVAYIDDMKIEFTEDHYCKYPSNKPEYLAVIRGLQWAYKSTAQIVTIYSDSELVVFQLQGRYKCHSKELMPYYNEAKRLIRMWEGDCKIKFVSGKNNPADKVSRHE